MNLAPAGGRPKAGLPQNSIARGRIFRLTTLSPFRCLEGRLLTNGNREEEGPDRAVSPCLGKIPK